MECRRTFSTEKNIGGAPAPQLVPRPNLIGHSDLLLGQGWSALPDRNWIYFTLVSNARLAAFGESWLKALAMLPDAIGVRSLRQRMRMMSLSADSLLAQSARDSRLHTPDLTERRYVSPGAPKRNQQKYASQSQDSPHYGIA
jgi:hypothetical protein